MKTIQLLPGACAVLFCALSLGAAVAAPGVPAAAPAGSAPEGAPGAPAETPAAVPAAATSPNEAIAANGLRVSADLRGEYVAGFPILVTVTVRNDTAEPLTFPDLAARPHLVRFRMKQGTVRWERYTTPPAVDPSTAWKLPPRAQRQVTLEIPSSAGLTPGDWELGLSVVDPAAPVELSARAVKLAVARPVGGSYVYESTIQQSVGAMIPWLHQAAEGFDLYLMQLAPKGSTRVVGQFHLAHLAAKIDPVLSRSRAADAASRYLYWASGDRSFTLTRLEGTTLRGKPRTVAVPYPKTELLGRGGTDAKGGVIIPLWVPDPAGAGGAVRALCVDDRGGQTLREITRLPAHPTLVNTAVDASGNLLLALGHPAGVDLYRIDPTLAPEIGARGTRIVQTADGWAPAAIAFDTLPKRGEHAGGLAVLSLMTQGDAETARYQTVWSDLAGKTIEQAGPLPWTAPGTVQSMLPAGYGPFYYLTTDKAGALWYGAQGAAPLKVDGARAGTLWPGSDSIRTRSIVGGTVIEDRVLGPLVP